MKNVGVAFVGLGEHIIRAHLAHLVHYGDVRLVSWFDPNPSAFDAVSPLVNSRTEAKFASFKRATFEGIVADQSVDAVFIGSPDKFHAEQLLTLVNAGKHVFCEKPMGVTITDVGIVISAISEAVDKNLVISSCHPRRFDEATLWLKDKLKNPANPDSWVAKNLGDIIGFDFSFWYHKVTDEWKANRSLLSDHFSHEIDLLRFLFGGGEYNLGQWHAKKIYDAHDRYAVDIAFENLRVRFSGARLLEEKVYQESLRILGSKGAVTVQLNTGKVFYERTGDVEFVGPLNYENRFKRVNSDFIGSVLTGRQPYLSAADLIMNNLSTAQLVQRGYSDAATL